MKKIILIVEDEKEEQGKAKVAAMALGLNFVIAETLFDFDRIMKMMDGKISGIVTDLHFPERPDYDARGNEADKPNGLAVIANAVDLGIPISVCSNVNNHFAAYLTRVIATFENLGPLEKIPFTLSSKDWRKACSELLKNIPEEK